MRLNDDCIVYDVSGEVTLVPVGEADHMAENLKKALNPLRAIHALIE